jgi:phosphopantetheinyl transferase
LRLSLSYGQGVAVLALRAGAIGVDLTPLTPPVDWPAVAATYFSPAHCAQLAALPPAQQGAAFAAAWAALEAGNKCLGLALTEYCADSARQRAALTIWHDRSQLTGHMLALAWS